MEHRMNLWDSPFNHIKQGSKTVELRLNDEKRQLIHKGDTLVFTNSVTHEEMITLVTGIRVFSNFAELYSQYDKISMGYDEDEDASPDDMLLYYSDEKIKKYNEVFESPNEVKTPFAMLYIKRKTKPPV